MQWIDVWMRPRRLRSDDARGAFERNGGGA